MATDEDPNYSLIAAHWLDRDDKTYFYGPFEGADEIQLGMLWLSDLWSDGIASGRIGLYVHHLSPPAWLKAPTTKVSYLNGVTALPHANPLYCKDRPVKGDPTCVLLAGHAENHMTQEEFDAG